MKKITLLIVLLFSMHLYSQNPCLDGKIIINGKPTDAVLMENVNNTGLKLPLWLKENTGISAGDRVHLISIIEFNEVTQNGNTTLVYSRVLFVDNQTATVPAGTVWKVEAIVKHSNEFASGFSASSNSPVCQGTVLNLTAPTVAGASYSWTGPNGYTSSVQNPTINNIMPASAGTYSMVATLNGCSSSASTTDVIVNTLPVSTFTSSPSLAITNNNVTFTPTLAGASYVWTFDQGIPASSTAVNPIVQWSAAGNYNVNLTVTDGNGCVSSTQQVISVTNCTPGQPSSAFSWVPVSPQASQTVTFSPSTSGAAYDWTFAGGSISTSTLENPDVSWSSTGTYSISLTVTSGGCFTTTTQDIIVKNPTVVNFNATGTGQNGTVQTFTVPAGVTSIIIEARGAQSGASTHGGITHQGGKGAIMTGTFTVTPGENLKIVVGQRGDSDPATSYGGGGGGGGSFVWKESGNVLLIAAGGGGGMGHSGLGNPDATTSQNGLAGAGNGYCFGTGGVSGNGGNAGCGGYGGTTLAQGGGAGWLSNGQNGTTGGNNQGGKSGPTWTGGTGTRNGGFGGGGGCLDGGGGGGGGYSGGGGNGHDSPSGKYSSAGGGGSYNIGTNQNNIGGTQTGNGIVTITY